MSQSENDTGAAAHRTLATRLSAAVKVLPPASFAFVMATGIVSSALAEVHQKVLSLILLVIAIIGGVVLLVASGWRLSAYRGEVLRDARNPTRAFGFFTTVAAANVVGIRLATAGHPAPAMILAGAAVAAWLLLTYAVPGALMLGPQPGPVAAEVNGTWFLWVVGTQSVAAAAATLGDRSPGLATAMAPIAVALWGVGVMLYLILAGLVTLRLLTAPSNPQTFSPAYWIYMGATAITVLVGARILALPPELPILRATAAVVAGLTYVLWAFGTWWIPLLVVFGVWRHVIRGEPVRYEAGLWSMVFPLGMYAAASILYGRTENLGFMVWIGQVEVWVALLAWAAVTVAMLRAARPNAQRPNAQRPKAQRPRAQRRTE